MRTLKMLAIAAGLLVSPAAEAGQMHEMCSSSAMTIPTTKRLTEIAFFEALQERSLPAHYRMRDRDGEQIVTMRALSGTNGTALVVTVRLIRFDGTVSTLRDERADGRLDSFFVDGREFRVGRDDQRDYCLFLAGTVTGMLDHQLRSGRGF